jgi:hypothetical protein
MTRPRYIIKKMHLSKCHAWRWLVIDCDKAHDDGNRYALLEYDYETAEDAMIFCNYLNDKEGFKI